MLVVTALLGAGMLIADTKGLRFQLPELASLKRLLPQTGEEDDDLGDYDSAEMDVFAEPAGHVEGQRRVAGRRIEPFDYEEEEDGLPSPELFDVHELNRGREELDELDAEIEDAVASLDDNEEAEGGEGHLTFEASSEPAADATALALTSEDDIMSFFEPATEVSKRPQVLADDIVPVSAADLLSEARQLQALLTGRRDPP